MTEIPPFIQRPGVPGLRETQRAIQESKLRYYPMEGEDLIEEIAEAESKNLPTVLLEALAFREGLIFGPDFYNINSSEQGVFLMNLFTTVESATDRPSEFYLEAAINERSAKETRILKRKAREGRRLLSPEEERTVDRLTGYSNWVKARKIVDGAFIQRMGTSHKDEAAAGLLEKDINYRSPISPDKGHWQAFFGITSETEPGVKTPQREFGQAVDRVLRIIVAAGNSDEELRRVNFSLSLSDGRVVTLGDKKIIARSLDGRIATLLDREKISPSIYATGFATSEMFRDWLSCLLQVANGRMDIVWAAWRLALIWELPSQFGHRIDEKNKDDIGLPPVVSDLFSWTIFLEEKRALEWGLDSNGIRVRSTKYITHTGYPVSLDKFGRLCESYLHETEVQLPENKGKNSLWDVWWKNKVSLADPKFPWLLTEISPAEAGREEAAPGSYQGWLLRRVRAFSVIKDIRSRPSVKEIGDPEFFGERVRTWDKIFGEAKDDLSPDDNPRTGWVAGLLLAHHVEATNKIPIVRNSPQELAYRTYFPGEVWSTVQKGEPGSRPPSVWEILNHAYQCGFLRKVDIDWLITNLNLPKPILGASPY